MNTVDLQYVLEAVGSEADYYGYEEVNVGSEENPRPILIKKHLTERDKSILIASINKMLFPDGEYRCAYEQSIVNMCFVTVFTNIKIEIDDETMIDDMNRFIRQSNILGLICNVAGEDEVKNIMNDVNKSIKYNREKALADARWNAVRTQVMDILSAVETILSTDEFAEVVAALSSKDAEE